MLWRYLIFFFIFKLNIKLQLNQGSPSYISQPHFLNADEKFVNNIIGMEPNNTLHDFILHLEPV